MMTSWTASSAWSKDRYWEEVEVGEKIPTIIKGPVDVADACARTMVSCYPYAYAIKWAVMREHLQHHPIDPDTGEHILRRDWHYTDHAANIFGYPYANSAGIQNEMMLVHESRTGWVMMRLLSPQIPRTEEWCSLAI